MIDDARRDQVQAAVVAAIVDASALGTAGNRKAIIDTAATVDALVNVVASLMASSPELQTPRARRLFGEALGRVVGSRIRDAQAHFAANGAPFHTIPEPVGMPC